MEVETQQEFAGALFVPPQAREQAFSTFERTVIVRLGPFRTLDRGRLLDRLRDSLVAALRRRDLSIESLAGVRRASTLLYAACTASEGYGRLVVTFESMAPLANGSALDGEDSRVLRDLLVAAETCDVTVVFDPEDATLEVFGSPVTLSALLPPALTIEDFPDDAFADAEPLVPTQRESASLTGIEDTHEPGQSSAPTALASINHTAHHDEPHALEARNMLTQAQDEEGHDPHSDQAFDQKAQNNQDFDEEALAMSLPSDTLLTAEALEKAPEKPPAMQRLESEDGTRISAKPLISFDEDDGADPISPHVEDIRLAYVPAAPAVRETGNWRDYVSALEALKGPQPLATLERLFATAYMPLGAMVERGLHEPRAAKAMQVFGTNFANVYRDASALMGHRHKLPRMVMDAPELAMREAREAGARHVLLLWCDALRFDVGMALRDALDARSSDVMTLVGETLLWSALPTTTPRQLETFIRGREALQSPGNPEAETSVLRERTADVVRKVRAGSRELYKLDLIEARLRRGPVDTQTLAHEVATSIDKFARGERSRRPHRTLLFVFGDHGYAFDRTSFHQGGAQPEQVLVPALSWVVDSVQ